MSFSAVEHQGEQAAPSVHMPQASQRGSGTVIELIPPQSDEAAATAVFKSLATAEPARLQPPQHRHPAAEDQSTAKQTKLWIAVGAAVWPCCSWWPYSSLNSPRGKRPSRRPRKRQRKPRPSPPLSLLKQPHRTLPCRPRLTHPSPSPRTLPRPPAPDRIRTFSPPRPRTHHKATRPPPAGN